MSERELVDEFDAVMGEWEAGGISGAAFHKLMALRDRWGGKVDIYEPEAKDEPGIEEAVAAHAETIPRAAPDWASMLELIKQCMHGIATPDHLPDENEKVLRKVARQGCLMLKALIEDRVSLRDLLSKVAVVEADDKRLTQPAPLEMAARKVVSTWRNWPLCPEFHEAVKDLEEALKESR